MLWAVFLFAYVCFLELGSCQGIPLRPSGRLIGQKMGQAARAHKSNRLARLLFNLKPAAAFSSHSPTLPQGSRLPNPPRPLLRNCQQSRLPKERPGRGTDVHMQLHQPAVDSSMMRQRCVIIGGTGRIGTAVAAHLLQISSQSLHVVLAGRDPVRGAAAVEEVSGDAADAIASSRSIVGYEMLDWRKAQDLAAALAGTAILIHTAGPYAGEKPLVLKAAIDSGIPVYVDLSDPVDYLNTAKSLDAVAQGAGTLALCAAGAFPGLSNVLAMECAARLSNTSRVKDIDFNYFTAGLGGSGEVNLLITNEGFGDYVPVYRGGVYKPQLDSGGGLRRVQFYLSEEDPSYELVGEKTVWNWPFPEGYLVARELNISGDSSVGMGTAPEIWNTVMGAMCKAVPRKWWRSRAFSQGLARFSRPLVAITDAFVGETHAMRIDVTAVDGTRVSAVQAHNSFRRIVGQSCAEFAKVMMEDQGERMPASGVYFPEQLFSDPAARNLILERLLSVKGTLNYGFKESGPSASGRPAGES